MSLKSRIEKAYALADAASSSSLLGFLGHVVIDSRPEPRPFRDVALPWQFAFAAKLAPAVEYVAGHNPSYAGVKNFFFCFPKGSDKSSAVARMVAWALGYSKRQWNSYVYARDAEQAGFLVEAMTTEVNLNPWLRRRLDFKNRVVYGAHDSFVKVMAADAEGSQGIRPDLVIFDELTAFKTDEVFNNVMSGVEKRPCVVIILSNAGVRNTWQWAVREGARTSSRWYHYHAPRDLPTWMDRAGIEENRKLLPTSMAMRLYDNVWIDGDEASFLSREEAQACERLGAELGVAPKESSDAECYGAVDFGVVKDRCVCLVAERRRHEGRDVACVVKCDVWQGSRERPVLVSQVERWIDDVRKRFNLRSLVVDQWQMRGTAECFQGLVPLKLWEARGGKQNFALAQALRSAVINRQLAWFPGCGDVVLPSGRRHTLVDELSELITRSMGSSAYRIDTPQGTVEPGVPFHDDRAVAAGMLLCEMIGTSPRKPVYLSDSFF